MCVTSLYEEFLLKSFPLCLFCEKSFKFGMKLEIVFRLLFYVHYPVPLIISGTQITESLDEGGHTIHLFELVPLMDIVNGICHGHPRALRSLPKEKSFGV